MPEESILNQYKNKLTPYLYSQVAKNIDKLSPNLAEKMLNEALMLSGIGIESEVDHKHFFYITLHLKPIAEKLTGEKLSADKLANLSHIVFSDLPSFPIDTIPNFYAAVSNALKECNINKIAYPIGYGDNNPLPARDVGKWIESLRIIYELKHKGYDYNVAYNKITENWDNMEKSDFSAWTRFYEEKGPEKYKTAEVKTAQLYYHNPAGNTIPMDRLKAEMPVRRPNIAEIEQELAQKDVEVERQLTIKKKIQSIISRLNAAEKLSTDPEGQIALSGILDSGLPQWLEALHKLKRDIQLAPMRNVKSTVLEDLIIRQGNKFLSEGYQKTGTFFIKLAQMQEAEELTQLIDNLNLNKEAEPEIDETAEIIVTAQMEVPVTTEVSDVPLPIESKPLIEVEEEADKDELSNVTLKDVIDKLIALDFVLKNREIPRQLAMVDLMLDKLGIASYFPALGEATRSALESNQYMSSRIDTLLSSLKGSMASEIAQEDRVNLEGVQDQVIKPEIERIKHNLENQEQKEVERKELDKKRREMPKEEKSLPIEMTAPVKVEKAPEHIVR